MSLDEERIHSLFKKLHRQLTRLKTPRPDNVHQFRTAARRLEAVLEELVGKPDRSERKLLKQLARLRRRAGRVRDIDVEIAALASLKISAEPGRKTQLMRHLAELREQREAKLLKDLDSKTVRELQKRVKRARDSFHLNNPVSDPLALARRMLARAARPSSTLSEEVLHRYRVQGKRIRYIAELANDTSEATAMLAQLKRMQDALGNWHDWNALALRAEKFLGERAGSAVLTAVKNITRAKLRDAIEVVAATNRALLANSSLPELSATASPLPPRGAGVPRDRATAAVA